MAARDRHDEHRRRRRKRLIRGLLLGGAAIGVPALVNTLVSRRAQRLPVTRWGSDDRYSWHRGEVVFQRLGEGPPLLLLHSFGPGHSAAEWRRTAELLALEHQVLALDFLGWGRSEKPSLTYDGELYLRLIADFLGDVVGERAAVAAAGLSAAYAVQLAADRPELFRGLALVGPLGIGSHADEPDLKDAVVHRLLRLPVLGTSLLNLYTSERGIAAHLRRDVFGAASSLDEETLAEHYRGAHERGAQTALAAYLSGYLNHSVEGALGRLRLPLWLAWGRHATHPPLAAADLWLQHRPEATLEVFERCGSLPHAESPEELRRKLEPFLAALDG